MPADETDGEKPATAHNRLRKRTQANALSLLATRNVSVLPCCHCPAHGRAVITPGARPEADGLQFYADGWRMHPQQAGALCPACAKRVRSVGVRLE